MAEARIEHIYDCNVETFWNKVVLNAEFNKKLYLEELGFVRWEIVESKETDDEFRRVVEVQAPTPDLPKVLAKLVDKGIRYRQEDTFDKKAGEMRTRIIPHVQTDRLKITAVTTATPQGDKVKRTFHAQVHAKIFGVGSIAEKRILDELRKGYDNGAAFANRYLKGT